jgi:hypothetical protein
MDTIDHHLDVAAGLTPAKKAQYRAAAAEVLMAMGPKALKRWNENVRSITFYPDTESIQDLLRREYPKPRPPSGVRGLCLRDRRQPSKCHLHVNGGSDTDDSGPRATRYIYAHEFAHGIDVAPKSFARLSDQQAWMQAWPAEDHEIRGLLHERKACGAREGFAHFASLAWNNPDAARRHHPKCWAFFSDWGLA